jgi:hypothetical protein
MYLSFLNNTFPHRQSYLHFFEVVRYGNVVKFIHVHMIVIMESSFSRAAISSICCCLTINAEIDMSFSKKAHITPERQFLPEISIRRGNLTCPQINIRVV